MDNNKTKKCEACDNFFKAVNENCSFCENKNNSQTDNTEILKTDALPEGNIDAHKTEISKIDSIRLQKSARTLSVAKTLFYVTGIVLIVVLFALNPKMHKKELRPIEYVQYNQNLTVGDKCSIDLVEAEYIASIKQTVGEAELGLQHYYMVKDDTGAAGIAMFEITSDTEKFETMISECLGEPLHFVGIIKEAPTSILLDVNELIESDSFTEKFDSAYEETKAIEELLSKYKIMGVDLDMPLEEKVTVGIGTGELFLLGIAASFIIGYMCSRALKKQRAKMKT